MLFFLVRTLHDDRQESIAPPAKDLTNRMRQHAYEGMLCLVG